MSADLTLEHLCFRHPGSETYAVRDIDLHVGAGQMMALLGSSGSGKSTALRLTAGLEQPQSGDVVINGVSQAGVAPERRGITMMFQKPLLFPHLSVIDNVAFADRVAGATRRQARANAARYLDLVHLGDLAHRRSRQLSGGQEQRVSLARALAANPKVLLLDEPFGALDTSVRSTMYDLLEEVRAMVDPTIVLVTHDLTEASLADRVAVLSDGAVAQVGTVPQLHAAPASVHVARLLGGFAEIPGEVRDGVHHSSAGRVPLPPSCAPGVGSATLLIHRQSVRLTPLDDDAGSAGARTDGDLKGMVTRLRAAGLRQSVSVALGPDPLSDSAGTSVEADIDDAAEGGPGADRLRVGARVRVRLASRGVWAVPTPGEGAAKAVTYSNS